MKISSKQFPGFLISSKILRQCQDDLENSGEIQKDLIDNVFFKTLAENGIKEGIQIYAKSENPQIDYAFVKVFAFDNRLKYTNEIRFSFIEKYLIQYTKDENKVRDLFRESCKFFDIPTTEDKFDGFGKKYGFIIPELENHKDMQVTEISINYYLEEISKEFTDAIDLIDDFLETRKQGSSKSYCLEKMQEIRGKLGEICNVKLAGILSFDLSEYKIQMEKIVELMDDISFTKEFNMKEYEPYKRLTKLLAKSDKTRHLRVLLDTS